MKLIHTHDYDSRYIPAMPIIEIGVARSVGQEPMSLTAIVDSGADTTQISYGQDEVELISSYRVASAK